jgi:hypothetical protein
MTTILDRTQSSTPYQFSRADLTPGTILMMSNADHIRCQVQRVDGNSVRLALLDNQLIDGKAQITVPFNMLAERGWRLISRTSETKQVLNIDPSDIRPGAILTSPVEGIRCRVDSVEHGTAKLSVLDNNTINGDKELTVVIGSDLLTGWHLMKKAA